MSDHAHPTSRPSVRQWMFGIGLLAVLPMLSFSLLAGRSLLNQQQAALHVELQQQADFGARELAREVRVMFATLDSLATSDAALRQDYEALHAHASRVVAVSPRIGAITAVDATGVRRFSTLTPFTVPLPPTSLGEFDRLVIATGERQVSPLAEGSISGKKLVSFSVPVKESNKIVLILRATMWSEAVAEIVYEQPVPTTWSAAVIDQNMIQIARSKDAARYVGQPATELTQAAIRAGHTTPYAAVSRDGVAMTASASKVAGTQWNVVVAAPSTTLETDVWQAFKATLWVGLFCAVLSVLGVWYLERLLRQHAQAAANTGTANEATSQTRTRVQGEDPF